MLDTFFSITCTYCNRFQLLFTYVAIVFISVLCKCIFFFGSKNTEQFETENNTECRDLFRSPELI